MYLHIRQSLLAPAVDAVRMALGFCLALGQVLLRTVAVFT